MSIKDLTEVFVGADFNDIFPDTVSAGVVPGLIPDKDGSVKVQSGDLSGGGLIVQDMGDPFTFHKSIHPVVEVGGAVKGEAFRTVSDFKNIIAVLKAATVINEDPDLLITIAAPIQSQGAGCKT